MGAAVVVVVDKWTEKAPSTFPQLFFCTLRNRWDNLKEITEKSLHYLAKSEVSGSAMNPLSTYYSQVKYKDPNDGSWSFFDDQRIWHSDFPYDTEKYSNSNFLAYRTNTKEIFLPLVLK